jgi:hypothetical protein
MFQPDLRKPLRHPRTASRVFSGEAVVISPAENSVRLLNPVGTRIWELADGARTVDEIADQLTREFIVGPDHARESTGRFLAELEAKGLIAWV